MSWDYNLTDKKVFAGAWMRSFYEANVFNPIYVRVTAASVNTASTIPNLTPYLPTEDNYVTSYTANSSTNTTYNVFMTSFDYEVVKRNASFDLVNISIEFTEI